MRLCFNILIYLSYSTRILYPLRSRNIGCVDNIPATALTNAASFNINLLALPDRDSSFELKEVFEEVKKLFLGSLATEK